MTRYQRCLINAAILKNLGASGLVSRQIMLTVSDAAKAETATWADRVSPLGYQRKRRFRHRSAHIWRACSSVSVPSGPT